MHQQVSRPSGDRREDLAKAQVQFRLLHRRLIRFKRSPRTLNRGLIGADGLGVHVRIGAADFILRTGDDPLFHELLVAVRVGIRVLLLRLIAREIRLGLSEERTIARYRGFGLQQSVVERAGVDLKQQVALPDVLPFREVGAHQFTGHLRSHLHGRGRLDVADSLQHLLHRLRPGSRQGDRHGRWSHGRRSFLRRAARQECARDNNSANLFGQDEYLTQTRNQEYVQKGSKGAEPRTGLAVPQTLSRTPASERIIRTRSRPERLPKRRRSRVRQAGIKKGRT